MTPKYYIISLKHTSKQEKWITLWRPNNAGYCYAKKDAGIYQEIEDGYHNHEGDSLPVETHKLDGYFIPHEYLGESIPNCKQVWDAFNLRMTKNGLVLNK